MDPWSKVDNSRIIREASMVVEKLPKVHPPSGRVPGQGLLAALILQARQRENKGEIAKRVLSSSVLGREVNICRRGARGWPRVSRRPPDAATRGAAPPGRLDPWWPPSGPNSGL